MRVTISGSIPPRFHEEVRRVISVGFQGTNDAGVELHVKARPKGVTYFSGRAYDGVPGIARVARTSRYLVTLHLPRDLESISYPRSWRYPGLKTAPEWWFCCWKADLLHLAAHEAAHIRQFQNGRRRSEIAAEKWAGRVIERRACLNGCAG